MKTGSGGRPWVVLDKPGPPKIKDPYEYRLTLSPRCLWWIRQILKGWRPNRRIEMKDCHSSALYYGVYMVDYLDIIRPLLDVLQEEELNGNRNV